MTKQELAHKGAGLVLAWCRRNGIEPPKLVEEPHRVGSCAYYRPHSIHLDVARCAAPGYGGRAWSWPGYIIDRTPYGVYQHELGHHVDCVLGGHTRRGFGGLSPGLWKQANEPAITGYPDEYDDPEERAAEWFAEAFRLFVTNPDLLRAFRPATHAALLGAGLKPVTARPWRTILEASGAPERTLAMAAKKVSKIP
jgi:hypothetical protein